MIDRIKELYAYREMIVSMVHRDLRGKYKASTLGFLWTFLYPLMQLVIYTVVFSIIMRAGIEKFYLYLFVGLVPWNFFSSAVSGGASCVLSQGNLVKKIYFPRIILPISHVTSTFVNMLLVFVVIFAVLGISGVGFSGAALCFLPLIMIIEYILALGLCMITSALTVQFRDVEYLLSIVMMALMYMTPIMYTVDMVPEKLRILFLINPMYAIIEAYHQILYFKTIPQLSTLTSAIIWGIGSLVIGIIVFEKLQRKFVEEL